MAKKVRWIHTNKEIESAENDGGLRNHGTCMLARAAGHKLGVAKNVSPIIVRVPKYTNEIEYYMEGLRRIVEDTKSKKRAGSPLSVLSLSIYWPRHRDGGELMFKNTDGSDGYDTIRGTMRGLLRLLVSQGVVPVTGSGNTGAVSVSTSYEFCRVPRRMGPDGLFTNDL